MSYKWIAFFLVLLLNPTKNSWGEEVTADPDGAPLSSPERLMIYSIGDRTVAHHPPVIDILPGEQISFRVDAFDFGNACSNPEGCPEGKDSEAFTWHADDRPDDECSARTPEACRDRTSFQPEGNTMIFHIPYAMGREITLKVTRENPYLEDTIVLRNAHYAGYADRPNYSSYPDHSYSDNSYGAARYDYDMSPELHDPYWTTYYPCSYWWGPYPYSYGCTYWPVTVGIGIGVGFGWGYAWGWGAWPYYRGWYGYGPYYHPGFYGYYHPGWGGYYGAGPRVWAPAGVGPRYGGWRPQGGAAGGPGNFERNSGEFGGRGGGFRRRWR
jgi:hypothetical protein